MPSSRPLGIAFWILIVVGGGYGPTMTGGTTESPSLWEYWTARSRTVVAKQSKSPPGSQPPSRWQQRAIPSVPVGTSVFSDDDGPHLIGRVTASSPDSITVRLNNTPPHPLAFTVFRNRGTMGETIALMMPPATRTRVEGLVRRNIEQHGQEIAQQIVPIVGEAISKSLPVIESEMRRSIERHKDEVDAIAQKWKRDVIRDRLIPMARKEVLPIVREHAEPTARDIGRELWDRASIWRFTWRAIYDKSPLPKQDLVREEWDRFVDEEVVPIFESRMDEIAAVVQTVILETAANPVVRKELAGAAKQIAVDEETRALVQTILRESIADNQPLRAVWSESLASDQARLAIDKIGDRIEPVVREIGDELFGTPETGISPGFARVLRNQVFGRDRVWVMAEPTTGSTHSLTVGTESMAYPLIHLANSSRAEPRAAQPPAVQPDSTDDGS